MRCTSLTRPASLFRVAETLQSKMINMISMVHQFQKDHHTVRLPSTEMLSCSAPVQCASQPFAQLYHITRRQLMFCLQRHLRIEECVLLECRPRSAKLHPDHLNACIIQRRLAIHLTQFSPEQCSSHAQLLRLTPPKCSPRKIFCTVHVMHTT